MGGRRKLGVLEKDLMAINRRDIPIILRAVMSQGQLVLVAKVMDRVYQN